MVPPLNTGREELSLMYGARGADSAPHVKVAGPSGLDSPTQLWTKPTSGVDPNTTLSSKDWDDVLAPGRSTDHSDQEGSGGGMASRHQQVAAPTPGFCAKN